MRVDLFQLFSHSEIKTNTKVMVIYGVGTYKGAPVRILRNCSDCHAVNSLLVIPVHKYVHFFFIPSFCCGKEYILKCDACGLHHEGGVTIEKNISKDIKAPIWMFTGLILGILLFSYVIWDVKTGPERDKKQALEYIETPQVGDIYEIKIAEKEFTLYKVDKIAGDSIYFLANEFGVTKSYDLSDLRKKEYADKYTIPDGYTKSDLKEAIEVGTILKINR